MDILVLIKKQKTEQKKLDILRKENRTLGGKITKQYNKVKKLNESIDNYNKILHGLKAILPSIKKEVT